MGVYIGGPIVISDMQGPAPDGFHVPLIEEWTNLINILSGTFGLASNVSTAEVYLKLPKGGHRNYNTPVVSSGACWYWSSSPNGNGASSVLFQSSSITTPSSSRNYGIHVRAFKNSPVVPDSNWIVLYDGGNIATGAGVFCNPAFGLISISGDGNVRYTMQDKNLGATVAYNQGDTLTDDNCGFFYQWGNNYGFPYGGDVTTSSTRVDASNYGPGNYYNSSTYITTSTAANGRSNPKNDNLWGGVTQGTTTKNTDLKNAYIGEYHESFTYDFTTSDEGWTPSSGTLRDSNGFYRTGEWSDGGIEAPSEVFQATPKKIIISYNKTDTSTGTGIGATQTYNPGYLLPYIYTGSGLNQMGVQTSGGTSYVNLGSNPTGNVDWEMDIDSTTTPRTITHSITGLNSFTNNSGVLDSLFNDQSLSIRIVNWTTTGGLHITGVTIEY